MRIIEASSVTLAASSAASLWGSAFVTAVVKADYGSGQSTAAQLVAVSLRHSIADRVSTFRCFLVDAVLHEAISLFTRITPCGLP
jgi:hypothetical protein